MIEPASNNQFLDDISMDDIYSPNREVAECAGLEAYIRLVRQFGGGPSIYFPKLAEIRRNVRNRAIVRDFDGRNYRELAKKYRLSTQQLYTIIKGSVKR